MIEYVLLVPLISIYRIGAISSAGSKINNIPLKKWQQMDMMLRHAQDRALKRRETS